MDDGIEILIYIFFILISVIGGIVKNVSKKKEEERKRNRRAETVQRETDSSLPPVGGPQTTVNPFEEFLRRQLEQFEEPVEEEVLDSVPTVKSQPIDSIPTSKSQPIDTVPSYINPPVEYTPLKSELIVEGVSAFESAENKSYTDNYFEKDFSLKSEIKDLEKFEYDAIAKGELTDIHEEMAEFEALKAVIYSEIIKRPVY